MTKAKKEQNTINELFCCERVPDGPVNYLRSYNLQGNIANIHK